MAVMNRTLRIFIFSYFITYILLAIFWVSGSSNGCTPGQEIEEGCKIAFPATFTFLAWVNIPIGLITGLVTLVIILIREPIKKKVYRKKWRERK